MKIKVRFFVVSRELAEIETVEFEFQESVDKQFFINKINGLYPGLSKIVSQAVLAVNNKYISGDFELHDRYEVNLIPPVSGG